jgi:Ca-activated chloride channel homolog
MPRPDDKGGVRALPADEPVPEKPLTRDNYHDWGASLYLSNDDTMSLSSAQRVLYAIDRQMPVPPDHIRPHEFLNYFSFDTAPVRDGDLFSVQAGAEQTAPETLTMAFAVKGAAPPRQSLDLTLVLDRSGSMAAEGRMEYLKRGLHKMESELKRGDRVDLVLFDSEVCTPLEDFVVGRDDPSLLTDAIERIQPRSATNLDAGLTEGYRIAAGRTDGADRNRRVLLITDALLNEGRIDPNIVSEVGRRYEESNIRLSAVGVGREFNDKVLDQLTEKGKGAYAYLGSEAVVDRIFGPMFDSLTRTVAHDVHFSVQLPPSLAMTRFYGEEASTVKEDVKPIHYFANTSQLFLQDVRVLDGRLVPNDPIALTVEWSDVNTGAARTQTFTSTVGELVAGDPRNLRKGRALMAWTDMISARAMGSDPCGQPFSAWTDRVGRLGEDAEIGWLDGLTSPLCGQAPRPYVASTAGVSYKVKVDSDQVIAEVQLSCAGRTLSDALSGSDTVARFDAAPSGSGCQLTLVGNVPMTARVDVPATGGEARCTVRGGRLACS